MMVSQENNRVALFGWITFILLLMVGAFVVEKHRNQQPDNTHKARRDSMFIQGRVERIESGHGSIALTIRSERFEIFPLIRPNSAHPDLISFIRVGDSIGKQPHSNVISVYRDDSDYTWEFIP